MGGICFAITFQLWDFMGVRPFHHGWKQDETSVGQPKSIEVKCGHHHVVACSVLRISRACERTCGDLVTLGTDLDIPWPKVCWCASSAKIRRLFVASPCRKLKSSAKWWDFYRSRKRTPWFLNRKLAMIESDMCELVQGEYHSVGHPQGELLKTQCRSFGWTSTSWTQCIAKNVKVQQFLFERTSSHWIGRHWFTTPGLITDFLRSTEALPVGSFRTNSPALS